MKLDVVKCKVQGAPWTKYLETVSQVHRPICGLYYVQSVLATCCMFSLPSHAFQHFPHEDFVMISST